MKAGFHSTDITPFLGLEVPGGYGKSYVRQIHDPLKVRAAVLEGDGELLAFVGLDTCYLPLSGSFVGDVRGEIERQCGIPAGHILLAASHTHSGGPLGGYTAADFADAPELVQTLFRDYSPNPSPLYQEWVSRQIISAVREAYTKRQGARLSVGRGSERLSTFNRRFRMRNGRVYTNPGKGNPDIVAPAGPIDPAVGVLAAWTRSGELLGCLVNFACHCTTFSGGTSADYVCYLERTVQALRGQDAVVVFLPGASGDIGQIDHQSLRERKSGERWSLRVGDSVAAEVVKVLAVSVPGELTPLAAATQVLPLPRRVPNPRRVAESRAIVEKGLAGGKRDHTWTFAKEIVLLDHLIRRQPELAVEVQGLQVGPAIFLANPSEFFAESGLRIKETSPFPYTFVVTLANGCVGYVPPATAFAPSGGGYETVLTTYSNLTIGAEEAIAAVSGRLARQFRPGAVPQLPQVAAPLPPWHYGVLGPELE